MVTAGHGSGIVSSAADVMWMSVVRGMRGVGGVCEMCMFICIFVCGCRTWMCLDITRFYEEQRQPSRRSAWPACPKTVNGTPIVGAGGIDTICTAVCNCHDSSTACRLCRLEPVDHLQHIHPPFKHDPLPCHFLVLISVIQSDYQTNIYMRVP